MKKPTKFGWIAAMLSLGLTLPVLAQDSPPAKPEAQAQTSEGDQAAQDEANVAETVVVTASRSEQRLQDVPAAMTVITGAELEKAPVDDYGDVLRNVPGLNVSQMSARDIQITGRAATNSLAAQELVLLDGRTVYLDFFGFVMWDLLPVNPRDIKQIEVVRGPGSAVWGANALSGVINLITKSPRESAGTSIIAGVGQLSTLYGSVSHAGASEKLGYKLSASYYEQDPYPRPTGLIPGTQTPYPAFKNQGTKQPKVDLRLDYDRQPGEKWSVSGGYAGTDGIIHSGIGPFDINSGTSMSYGKVSWFKNTLQANLFANILNGEAKNLLTVGADGKPLILGFDSDTYNLDVNNTSVVGSHHLFTYGGNARHSDFDLSIAPKGDARDEYGAFVQDEISFGSNWRWLLGGRWDNIDPIGSVYSPRTSLMWSPTPDHTFRVSYNRAFKAPSVVQNFIDIVILNAVTLPTGLYIFPSRAAGNPKLKEERLDAFEVGYVGNFGHAATFTLSLYRNKTRDSQDFYTSGYYTAANPPPRFPLPAVVLNVPPPRGLAGVLPSGFNYRNIGEIVDKGAELSLNLRPAREWRLGLTYSYQADPDVSGIPESEVNKPPRHRANLDVAWDGRMLFANTNINYVDDAFWTDVLDARFHGPTDAFTQVNVSLGVRLLSDRLQLSVIGSNIFDERVQQHVFGDIITRKITAQVLFSF